MSVFWAIPTLLLCVYILKTGRWKWLAALMPFAALAYPMMALAVGMTCAIHLCLLLFADRQNAKALLKWLAAGSLLAVSILAYKYAAPPAFLGPMADRDDVLAIFKKRGKTVPLPSFSQELTDRLANPFVLYSAMVYLVVLGRKKIAWDRTWTSLLIAAMVGYSAAVFLFPQLYIPNRYSRYAIVVLLVFWHANNLDRIVAHIGRSWLRRAVLLCLLIITAVTFKDTFKQDSFLRDATGLIPLSRFIRQLPADILLAGPPHYLDDLVVQSRKPAMQTYLMDHRWYRRHTEELHRRYIAIFDAIYAADAGPVNSLHSDYGATHLVISRSFYGKRLRKGAFRARYNREVRQRIGSRRRFLLQNPPTESVVYDDGYYKLIRLPLAE